MRWMGTWYFNWKSSKWKNNFPVCIKANAGPYPEDCGGVYGYDEYSEDKEERLNPDIEFLNNDLEDYKNFAEMIYNRYMD